MDLTAARTIAIDLMTEHGLIATGWHFQFYNAQKRLGVCKYHVKQITISRYMVGAADEEQVRQTMLHEVAHALVGHAAGHGPIWKAKAAAIGYTGKRTSTNPYVEQQRANAAKLNGTPVAAPNVDTSVRLRPGQTGVITTGRYTGVRATVRRVNTSRYTADVEGVGPMYIPFAMLRPSLGAAILTGPVAAAPAPKRLRAGERGVFTNGRLRGVGVTVENVGRTRYHVVVNGTGARYTAPFAMVEAT